MNKIKILDIKISNIEKKIIDLENFKKQIIENYERQERINKNIIKLLKNINENKEKIA